MAVCYGRRAKRNVVIKLKRVKMENGQKTLTELFDGRKIFNIPIYQRAYAWREKQLEDFFDDIENQNIDKPYFWGTILFQDKGRNGIYETIDIVDGQQRVTTIIIFLKVLLETYKALSEEKDEIEILTETYIQHRDEIKLRILEQDNEFFKSYIVGDNIPPDGIDVTPSQRYLLAAKSTFKNKLMNKSLDDIKNLISKIEKSKTITYSVIDDAEATLIFETTNDRGKSLTNLEKIKSFLMYKIYLASVTPSSSLSNIQNRFSEIYRDYEAIEEFNIPEDSILQYHFIAFENWSTSQGDKDYQKYFDIVKRNINDLLKSEKNEETLKYIDKYSLELREVFSIMKTILLNKNAILRDIFILDRTATFYPLLIKAFKHEKNDSKNNFYKVADMVANISFTVYGLRRRKSNTGVDKLFALARDFEGNYDKLVTDMKSFVMEYCNAVDFVNSISSPSFNNDIASKDKYFMFWKYENFLRTNEQPVSPEMSFDEFYKGNPKTRISIEHIMPQTPRESTITQKEFEEKLLHNIGNLVIDSTSANSSKGNQDFRYKFDNYYSKAPLKSQNELASFIENGEFIWDDKPIGKRKQKIIQFSMQKWVKPIFT